MTNTGIIILAAGKSKRFGSDKRQALIAGTPLLLSTVQAYAKLVYPIVVVVSNDLSAPLMNKISSYGKTVSMPERLSESAAGMGDSLAIGIQKAIALEWDAALIALGDMPFIQYDTLNKVAQALTCNHAVVPVYDKRWGHPVGFQRSLFAPLAELRGDRGARRILELSQPKEIPVNDPGVLIDIDTPDQLARP